MKMKNRDGEYKKFLGYKDVTNHSPKVEETIQSTHLKKKYIPFQYILLM